MIRAEDIEVRPAFAEAPRFLLARGAVAVDQDAAESRLLTGAAAGIDADTTALRAFAELIERVAAYLGGLQLQGTRGSYRELRRRGRVVDPRQATHFDVDVAARLDPVDHESELTYCRGGCLIDDSEVLVPALLAFSSFRGAAGEPIFIKPGGTGLAAHTSAEAAILHGLLEVLERDACMLSWRVPGWPCRHLTSEGVCVTLRSTCMQLGLELELYEIGDPELVPVVLALVCQPDGSQLSLGSAAGYCIEDARDRAIREALMLQWTLMHHGGNLSCGAMPRTSLQHVQCASRNGASVRAWYHKQSQRGGANGLTRQRPQTEMCSRDLGVLVQDRLGGDVVSVDVGQAILQGSGWHVVRVLATAAQPRESDAMLVHNGGPRLHQAGRRYSRGEPIRTLPNPFG